MQFNIQTLTDQYTHAYTEYMQFQFMYIICVIHVCSYNASLLKLQISAAGYILYKICNMLSVKNNICVSFEHDTLMVEKL